METVSTIIISKIMNIVSIENSRFIAVINQQRETLADFVRRVRNEKGFSTRRVQELSGGRNSGRGISDSYVSRIENGEVRNVTPEKLRALAKGLEVSEDEIFTVARGKQLEYEDPLEEVRVLFYGWADASDEDKAATMEAIKMIAEGFQRRRAKYPRKIRTSEKPTNVKALVNKAKQ